ncbi:tyrosine-type recombinase/integrase [Brevundimonas lutea]|uniref:tyrosine-type recombinase/integrase n=1 Tax=Brevundimonas lutea TaxID=2293980 RepID=UPI000F03E97C|nr:site-specific integrase [Brevundimonas lutea]
MPKRQTITTDRQILSLKSRASSYELSVADARGLALRVLPSGSKSFEFRYVNLAGRRRRMVLGAYPSLGLSQARNKAMALRVAVVDGADPAGERIAAREAARTGETLSELAEAYWPAAARGLHGGRRRPKTPGVIRAEQSRYRLHIEPKLGSRVFTELKRRDIRMFMRDLAAGSGLSPNGVASIGTCLSSILAFAVFEDRIEFNPATGLTRPLALRTRERMFDDEGLRILRDGLVRSSVRRVRGETREDMAARIEPETALALRFLLLTLTRRGEVAGARWSEVDRAARIWTVPAERMKARRAHVVPLSAQALEVLDQARSVCEASPFIFPSVGNAATHLQADLLTRAVSRLCNRLSIAPGSPHDFRRSGATTLTTERYGVRRFVVSKVLAHTPTDGASLITAVYDRNDYLPEKRQALELWGGHVARLGQRDPRTLAYQPRHSVGWFAMADAAIQ